MASRGPPPLGSGGPPPRRASRVAVVGDAGSGKSSLVAAACLEQFSDSPVPVLPPVRFPTEIVNTPEDLGEILVIDTSSKPEDARDTEAAVRSAAAVVICVDASRPAAVDRLRALWMPEVARLNAGAPVVVAACKDDRGDRADTRQLRAAMESLVATCPALEVSIRCSAREMRNVTDVFYHAIKAVLFPKAPLLEASTGRLTTPCVKALLRIFLMCDIDQDGALNDEELNAFQYLCFGQPLSDEELDSVKAMVAERMPEGISDAGLMFPGFMYLHTLFLTRGRLESTWTVLKAFGYSHDLHISEAVLGKLPQAGPDAVLELSAAALANLTHVFDVYDSSRAGVLSGGDMEHMFNRAPVPIYQLDAWNRLLVPGSPSGGGGPGGPGGPGGGGAAGGAGGLTRDGYLTRWKALALQDPRVALEQMMYLGLGGRAGEGAGELFDVKPRRRRGDRRADLSSRTTLHCAAFGAPGAGKSALLRALAARPPGEQLQGALCAAASVAVGGGGGKGAEWDVDVKTMLMTEVPSTASAEALGVDIPRVDVAAVVYDASDADSFAAARALAEAVSTAGGEGLPVVLVAAKDDLGSSPELQQEVAAACADLALPPPLHVAALQGALGQPNAFRCLAEAALRPEGHIPDTPARKLRRRNVRRAWVAGGVAVTAALGGYMAYRLYQSGYQSGGGGGGKGGSSSSSGGAGGEAAFGRRA